MIGLPAALAPLAARDQFVTWITVPHATKAGKWTKLPCAPASGAVVDAHNPAHWTNAETARAVAQPAPNGGVGFVFTADDPWFFLDIDNCLLPDGTWSALAQELCALFAGAAVEVSHSGKGLHIFGRYSGELPPHGTKNTALGLEFYTSGRFVALTGHGARGDVDHDCTAILAAWLAFYLPPGAAATREPGEWTTEPVAEWSGPLDDGELVRLAIKAGSKPSAAEVFGGAARASFGVLWHAEADSLARVWPGNSPGGYDASHVDMALANHLAFWTGKNCERMERLMRQSALVREKWDSPSHRGYLETTILKACAYVTGVATGRRAAEAATSNANGVASPADIWPAADLTVIEPAQIPPPNFPRAVLGQFWAEWCDVAAKGANAPFDYSAAGLITIAATLIGNARVAAATPDWHEPPVIWAMNVGPPSAGKSPALDAHIDIVDAIEADMAVTFDATTREHATALEASKQRKEIWTEQVKRAAKEGVPPPIQPTDAVEPDVPQRPRVRISDVTLEATAEIGAGNEKGLMLYRDELAGWWRGFNRYGGDGEKQFWLEAFGARPYTVDRKKAGRPIRVNRLAICILGGVQPDVLSTMLDGEADGFAARFLYVFPDPVDGFKLQSAPVDRDGARLALDRLRMLQLVDDGQGRRKPFICKLTNDAAAIFERWWAERRKAASQETGLWGGWLGKQGGQVLRLALIIEHLWWCVTSPTTEPPRELTRKAVEAAITLIDDWAAPMAKRAFGASAVSPAENDVVALARWLKRTKKAKFNAPAARRSADGPGGRLAKAAHMNAACIVLVEAGLIRESGGRSGETKGRQKLDYEVNPALLGNYKLSPSVGATPCD